MPYKKTCGGCDRQMTAAARYCPWCGDRQPSPFDDEVLVADGGHPRGPRGGATHPDPDGRDHDEHFCDICDTPFASVAALIKHDCEDYRDVATDGGVSRRQHPASVDDVRTLAGVADQDSTCPHGDPECAQPGTAPCFDCLTNGGDSDAAE